MKKNEILNGILNEWDAFIASDTIDDDRHYGYRDRLDAVAKPAVEAVVAKVAGEFSRCAVSWGWTREFNSSSYLTIEVSSGDNIEVAGDIRISDHAQKYEAIYSIDPSMAGRVDLADLADAVREAIADAVELLEEV